MAIWQIFGDATYEMAATVWPISPSYIANGNYTHQPDSGPFDQPYRSYGSSGDAWPGGVRRAFDLTALDDEPDKVVVGVWWFGGVWSNLHAMIAVQDESEGILLLGVTNGNAVRVRYQPTPGSSTSSTVIQSDNSVVNANAWTFYELVLERVGGNLVVQVFVDDVLLMETTVDDPFTGGLLHAGLDSTRGSGAGSTTGNFHGGYVADERVGPTLVDTIRPALQGFHDEWTPPDSPDRINNSTADGSLIEGSTGERTTYEFNEWEQVGGGDVYAVAVDVIGSTAGALPQGIVRQSGADEDLPVVPVQPGPERLHQARPVKLNPATSELWNQEAINAAEWGLAAVPPEED